MAYTGLRLQGICPFTEATSATGETKETLGAGFLTKKIMTIKGSVKQSKKDLYAGDRLAETANGAVSGTIAIKISELDENIKVAVLGCKKDATTGEITYNSNDIKNYCRCASLIPKTIEKEDKFIVKCYLRVEFENIDDEHASKEKDPDLKGEEITGTISEKENGDWKKESEFKTYEEALTYMKTLLNIKPTV